MSEIKTRAQRREQQSAEIEASQANLRRNIAETKRLVDESEEMIRRQGKECAQDKAAAKVVKG